MLGGSISLASASQGSQVAWIVPTYKNGRTLWRWSERVTANLCKAGKAKANKTERLIEFTNGGFLGIYSADSPDSIRGEAFHLVVLDEAARIDEEAWTDAIQPTLADFDGNAFLISTPKGINWFYREYQRGLDNMRDIAAFHASSNRNPSPQIKKAFRLAKERVPERTFKQEWLAEFVEDGAYFQGVDAACIIQHPDSPGEHPDHTIIIGADWGKTDDYTVFTAACRECNRAVDWERFNQIDFIYQRERLYSMVNKWEAGVLPERNSIGEPNIEILQQQGIRVLKGPDDKPGFMTLATTKPQLIEGLAQAIATHGYKLPDDYRDELRVYQVEAMDGGRSKFSAPTGAHDDRVISAALSWWGITHYTAPAGSVEEIDLSVYKSQRRR